MTNFISSTTIGDIKVEMFKEDHRVRLKVNNIVLPKKFRSEKSAHLYSVSMVMKGLEI